LPIWM